ncbi:serine/threonine-protein kinase [Gracilibacillus oryzae]|uniref:Serine/threonine-protein kinase n=1 Tax=Gracilibacillus oryzae TaxID=1672701 RepID=A0A7C8GX63_9BACI|nr:protein kinase [Gracilibacillus oryzae]KAB8139381.1 serine/threonine-protein kinase [Gracilibacillus oryzae]
MELIYWLMKRICQKIMDKTYPSQSILAERYKIEKVLGDGSYGIAYLCIELESGSKCVVKQMRKSKKKENEKMYKQETAALQLFDHPSIPYLIETFTYEGNHFFSMEFIEGDNLEDLLFSKKKVFNEAEALLFFRQLLEIVAYTHKQGIAHCDIRIPNVMLSDNQIYLIDFGLSQCLDNIHKKEIVQDDFFDLGDFLLFILYSTYDAKSKKNRPWTEELHLHNQTTGILKKLLQIEQPYSNVHEIITDVHHAINVISY